MIKKIICCFGAICLLLWSGVPAQAQENVPEPSVSAASAILIEAETGRVLFSKNAEEQRAMGQHHKDYDGAADSGTGGIGRWRSPPI